MRPERIVVIGASAGGVSALEAVVAHLPGDFRAPVLIVLHIATNQEPLLPLILEHSSSLPVAPAHEGDLVQPGRIYVAIADRHLLVEEDRVRLTKGPKENHCRPSIDVLFRSAAYYYGSRAVGVVLSGALSDGSSGLVAIKRLGGIAITQDPDEAAYSSMPLSAIRYADIDYTLPAAEIGLLLANLIHSPAPGEPLDAADYREGLRLDVQV